MTVIIRFSNGEFKKLRKIDDFVVYGGHSVEFIRRVSPTRTEIIGQCHLGSSNFEVY